MVSLRRSATWVTRDFFRILVLFSCILLPGCPGGSVHVSMVASDPEKLRDLSNEALCADFLALLYNNMTGGIPTNNIFREVARRGLACRANLVDGSVIVKSSWYDELKYPSLTEEVSKRIMEDLKNGTMDLDCLNLCAGSFIRKQPDLYALDLAENWTELALDVGRIGYKIDLGYYYLGQAAQGLGYHHAAIKYYATSAAMAAGNVARFQCAAEGSLGDLVAPSILAGVQPGPAGGCAGIDIPSVVPVLIKASRDALGSGG